jgi:hypothetical protein
MARLGHQTEVGRERAGVRRTRGLLVRVRRGEVVRELAGPLEHLAVVVRAVLVLDLLGHRARLVRGVAHADEVAPRDAVERVAGGADLAVDLVAAPDARVVERVEPAAVRPRVLGRVEALVCEARRVHLADERERAVEVRVPRDGADRRERGSCERAARVGERLAVLEYRGSFESGVNDAPGKRRPRK